MKTMKWLLQREFWEHKGAMFWAPIVVGAAMVVFLASVVGYNVAKGNIHLEHHATVNGMTVSQAFDTVPQNEKEQIVAGIANGYMAVSAPLFIMLSFVVFFYCLGALYDERRDRSILFWKSLPVSDQETVLSKVVTALVVAPLITMAVATFTSVLLLLIGGAVMALNGVNLFGPVLSSSAVYLAPLQLFGLLPVYAFWALPTVGYLLMMSAWAKSKVFLWAVGVPLICMLVIFWSQFILGVRLDMEWFGQHIVARGLGSLLPGAWLPAIDVSKEMLMSKNEVVNLNGLFVESWKSLASPHAWGGAIAGAAMIFAAMRLRRWKDEG